MDQGIGGTGIETDDLAPARGIIFGFLLSAAGWGVLVGFWVGAFLR